MSGRRGISVAVALPGRGSNWWHYWRAGKQGRRIFRWTSLPANQLAIHGNLHMACSYPPMKLVSGGRGRSSDLHKAGECCGNSQTARIASRALAWPSRHDVLPRSGSTGPGCGGATDWTGCSAGGIGRAGSGASQARTVLLAGDHGGLRRSRFWVIAGAELLGDELLRRCGGVGGMWSPWDQWRCVWSWWLS